MSQISVSSNTISSHQLPGTKYCPGCKQLLDIDLFGVATRAADGITSRCRRCNNKATHANYSKDFEKISARKHEVYVINHPKKTKYTYILLKTLPPEGTKLKKCPYCRTDLSVCPEMKHGTCHKCGNKFTVHNVLSDKFGGIKLHRITEKTEIDFKSIVKFIQKHKETYRAEIIFKLGMERTKVHQAVEMMEKDGLIITRFGGRFLFISLSEAGLKLFNSYQVDNVL